MQVQKDTQAFFKRNIMRLYIKNMVSRRCKMKVEEEIRDAGLLCKQVELGMAEVEETASGAQIEHIRIGLLRSGLELLTDKKKVLVERIKNVIIEMVHYSVELPEINFSFYISKKLGYDYTYLANVFSDTLGVSIQQFTIRHKIEKVKELLLNNDMNLTEISYRLHYSSVAHLSGQFKKITGQTPSLFRQVQHRKRALLENV